MRRSFDVRRFITFFFNSNLAERIQTSNLTASTSSDRAYIRVYLSQLEPIVLSSLDRSYNIVPPKMDNAGAGTPLPLDLVEACEYHEFVFFTYTLTPFD